MAADDAVDSGPVTVVVTRIVRRGCEAAYEAWLHGVGEAAQRFPGHLGRSVLRPAAGERQYTLIFRFDSLAHLMQWEGSREREEWVARVSPLCEGAPDVQRLSGLESWFALPGRQAVVPPPRYKMALVSFVAAFPLMQLINRFALPRLEFLPALARGAFVGAVFVLLMTYAVMPQLTRLLRRWLYPIGR